MLTIEGTRYEVRLSRSAGSGVEQVTLLGADGKEGSGLFVAKDGASYGSVTIGEMMYRVVVSGDGTNISAVAALPDGCEVNAPEEPEARIEERMNAFGMAPVTIDMIGFYTPAAKLNGGGESAVRATIDLAVADLNQILANNELPVTVRVVQVAEVNYTESATLLTDLTRFATEGDGHMDTVQVQKRRYKADIASLFVWSPDKASGQAYLVRGTNQNAYSVTQIQWAVGILAHEIGHNLGCSHDRANASGTPAATYAYGYKFMAQGQSFRTVMAYPPGMRVSYFSSPKKFHLGMPVGSAMEDNARIIAERAAFISNIEIAPPPAPEPPKITVQPASQWVKASETATFQVKATGAPTLRYQWMKNGVEITDATSATYVVMRATSSAAGVYSVRVWNGDGAVVSSGAMLSVEEPEVVTPPVQIVEQPGGLIVRRGEEFILSVGVTPTTGVEFQWSRNGLVIEGANGPSLLVRNAERDDSGQYRVFVMNETGSEESALATVITVPAGVNTMPRQTSAAEIVQIVALGRGGTGLILNRPTSGECEVQFSTDFRSWNSLGEVSTVAGLNTFIDLQPYATDQRYYRVHAAQ